MITLPDFIAIALAAVALYQLQDLRKQHNARLTMLERREPEKRVQVPVQPVREWEKPIDNFTPKKPETLRPNQVRGREVDQNVFEFDSKL